MFEFFRRLFVTDFMPHVYCLREPSIILLHTVSDCLIALSYSLIPIILIILVRRRRDLPFRAAYLFFGVFILACGATHVLGIVTLWHPVYRLEGLVKAITAFASIGTAILLVRILPDAVALPGPNQFRHEIEERRRAEAQVTTLNAELESKVRSRTQQLETANDQLAERTLQLEVANEQLAELAATLDKAQTIIQKLDGTILFWNSGAEALYGWSRQDAMGRKSYELLQSQLPQPIEEIQAALLENGSWTGEYRQRCQNGSIIWVTSYWALHRNANGEPVSVVIVNNDITELKRTSAELRSSEGRARSLFENASQGILTADRDGWIVDANAMVVKLFGYTRDELIGASVEMLLPENLRSRHSGHRATYALHPHARPMGQGMDLVARRRDGSEFPVEISLSYVTEHQNGLTIAFISDITARKQAHLEREGLIAQLESALAEKTVLLKEVHHRVKNNLAVIAGLLGMQSERLDNEQACISLAESQQRVLSMALIHEYLYSNERLDRVNFGQYIRQLATEVSSSYAMESDMVSVVVEAEEIELPVHRAVPCGLILNELLSNAFKYAYPRGQTGEINIRFVKLESGKLSLACHDMGVGVPEDFDWRNSQSLGLRITQILTKQIDGELVLDRCTGGTRFELCFPGSAEVKSRQLRESSVVNSPV